MNQSLPSPSDLHAQIMNLPCTVPDGVYMWSRDQAYRVGHRDARHAAAALASEHAADLAAARASRDALAVALLDIKSMCDDHNANAISSDTLAAWIKLSFSSGKAGAALAAIATEQAGMSKSADGVKAPVPTDSFPEQSILHDEANVGNCLQATIAGVLGWPLESVPHFALLGEVHWWDCAQAWLESQGYWIDYKPDNCTRDGGELLPRCWQSGPTVRGTQHAVIGDSATGQMLHDPHPSRAGLTQVDFTVYFFRKPAAGVSPSSHQAASRTDAPADGVLGTPEDQPKGSK